MTKLITRFQTEDLSEVELQSKFTCLQEILLRTQREHGERVIALASLETVQAALNRKRMAPRP